MGKQAAKKQARKEARKDLSLKTALLTSPLLKRYEFAVALQITTFFAECGLRIGSIDQPSRYISILQRPRFEGESKSLACDGLASLQYRLPQAVGHFCFCWKLVKCGIDWSHQLELSL